jgi:hypothetical protein
MRLFKHPPLAFWTAVCAVLGVVLVVGSQIGEGVDRQVRHDRSDVTETVLALNARIPTLLMLAESPDERLTEWAAGTAQIAGQGRQLASGPLEQALEVTEERARTLADVDTDEPTAVDAAVGDVLDAIDQLTSTWFATPQRGGTNGAPAPSLPGSTPHDADATSNDTEPDLDQDQPDGPDGPDGDTPTED